MLKVKVLDFVKSSGPEGTRTPDLHSAIVALSQLSYRPDCGTFYRTRRRSVKRGGIAGQCLRCYTAPLPPAPGKEDP